MKSVLKRPNREDVGHVFETVGQAVMGVGFVLLGYTLSTEAAVVAVLGVGVTVLMGVIAMIVGKTLRQ